MQTLLERLRDLVQTDTVIGKPITAGNVTIIPVSRISVGFGAGGNMKSQGPGDGSLKGGGGGGGVKVEPLGFVVITGEKVEVIPMTPDETTINKVVGLIPDVWSTISSVLGKKADK